MEAVTKLGNDTAPILRPKTGALIVLERQQSPGHVRTGTVRVNMIPHVVLPPPLSGKLVRVDCENIVAALYITNRKVSLNSTCKLNQCN